MTILIIGFLILLTAPWFFMMARLKNMGYTRSDVRRFFDDFGWCIGALTITSLVVGVLSDVLFNLVYGSIIFREFPREFMFTSRVKRWAEGHDGYYKAEPPKGKTKYVDQYLAGDLWRDRLNRIMPDHV